MWLEFEDAQDDSRVFIRSNEIALISHKERPSEIVGVSQKISLVALNNGIQVLIKGHPETRDLEEEPRAWVDHAV